MEVIAQKRVNVFHRIGGKQRSQQVCVYWLEGRCTRNPCKFIHKLPPNQQTKQQPRYPESDVSKTSKKLTWKNPNHKQSKNGTFSSEGRERSYSSSTQSSTDIGEQTVISDRKIFNASLKTDDVARENISTAVKVTSANCIPQEIPVKQCKYWVTGHCVHGDKCQDLHSWFSGSGFTMLTKLEGHNKDITGISLPSGCDKLYSGGKDNSIRAWDCNSGQCVGCMGLDGEVGCMISEGPWVFVGLPNAVRAWSIQNNAEVTLNGLCGQVNCMTADDGVLFTGMEDGTILVWKWNLETIIPEPVAILKEHNSAVCSLVIGAGRLYSGSRDCTVKMWNMTNLQCMQTLHGHERDVTSLICWDRYLLTASLDNTIKVWGATETGTLAVIYERKDDCGVIAMCGIGSSDNKPVLLCSYKDNTTRLYDLPSFSERGRIFSKRAAQVIQVGVGGLFFTGDATGEISVWKTN